jgi:sugar/nucleoside kinase (ribokinase family)
MYSHPHIVDLLGNVTYCIPSKRAAMSFTRETDPRAMCETLLRYGPKVAGVTLGEDGVVFMSATEYVERGAFKVSVLDTTGAGDVFHGAFCFGMANGWQLTRTVEFSSAVSALKCTKLGGRAGIPTYPLVDKFLEERVEEIR